MDNAKNYFLSLGAAFLLVWSGSSFADDNTQSDSPSQESSFCQALRNEGYDKVIEGALGGCAALVKGENPLSSDFIDGDLLWITQDEIKRVGPYPRDVVVHPQGLLMVMQNGGNVQLQSWDPESGVKVCVPDISLQQIHNKKVRFVMGPDFIRHHRKTESHTYFHDCQNKGREKVYAPLTQEDRKVLERFKTGTLTNDLTAPERAKLLPEIIGRDVIVDDIIAKLRSDSKRSTLLWGPAGVGKTAIVERLATRIARGEVPDWLKGWSVYLINLGTLAEEGVKGKSQKKMAELIGAAEDKKVILLMDEIHQLVGMGSSSDNKSDITEVMKTSLANGQLAVIGTLTDNKHEVALLRTKEAFFSRFSKIPVDSPPDNVLMMIYQHRARKLMRKFKIQFTEKTINKMIEMSRHYIPKEHHPRIGITLMENIASRLENENPNKSATVKVSTQDIKSEIAVYANIDVLKKGDDGRTFEERVVSFRDDVQGRFIGQGAAIETVYRSLSMYAAGVQDKERPAGVFLFLGPSGVGKTYLAELVAQQFGLAYKEWPMSQFTDDSNVTTFLGAPPSYVGYNPAGGLLTQWINNNPASVLNFDEIDKADPRILEALMGLMENGRIVDNSGVEARFNNGLIFFTSNFGMDLIDAYDKQILGIQDPDEPVDAKPYEGPIPQTEAELKATILGQLRAHGRMGTYIAGRIGESRMVIFHHLDSEESRSVAKLTVKRALKRLNTKVKVEVDASVIDFIVRHGFSFSYGARRARQIVDDYVTFPVAERILSIGDQNFKYLKVVSNPGSKKKPTKVEVIK